MFAIAAGVFLLAVDLRQIWAAHETQLREANTSTANLARSIAQHVQDVFDTTDALLKTLRVAVDDEGSAPDALSRLSRRLRVSIASQAMLKGMFMFGEQGQWLANSLPPVEFNQMRDINEAERAFFQFHRDHAEDSVLVGKPVQSRIDGAWVITLSRRLNHPDGSFAGVVATSIRYDVFQQFFETFDVGQRGTIALVNDERKLLVRKPYVASNIGRSLAQAEFYQQVRSDADSGTFAYRSLLDGAMQLGSFRRVPGFALVVVVSLNESEVLASWWRDTQTHLVALAVILLTAVYLGSRLMRQIRERVEAQAVSTELQLEAHRLLGSKAERDLYERTLERSNGELSRLNASIRRSETRFRQVVEAAPNAMLLINAAGQIEMVNAQTERLFGYPSDEMLGHPVEMLLPTKARRQHPKLRTDFFMAPTSRVMGVGRAVFGQRKDGSEVELEIGLSPMDTDDGLMVLSAIVDISSRVRMEAQMRQSQKMHAIGRVSAGVAHDFNNLLLALSGSLEMLLEAVADRPAAVEWGEIALRATTRGKQLTERLLSFSRKQHLVARPIQVDALFHEFGELTRHLFETSTKGRTELVMMPSPPGLAVMADLAQLEAALLNLAVNAHDAMEHGGCLRISAYAAGADLAIVAPGHYTVISVADTGSGMDAATLAQACEPFFSTKGLRGTGLGLSMVQGFARQSGGEAHITSVVGEGTTIDLWLPSASVVVEELSAITLSPIPSARVLVVDDAEDALLVAAAFLRSAGLEVTSRASGELALAELTAGKRFRAIVTDFAMPGMNGVELLRRAREIDPSMASIMITGFFDPELQAELNDTVLLRKPFNRVELVTAVRGLLVVCVPA
jgi:PAS domain S-box-containing protein